jgi:hypothetical protein
MPGTRVLKTNPNRKTTRLFAATSGASEIERAPKKARGPMGCVPSEPLSPVTGGATCGNRMALAGGVTSQGVRSVALNLALCQRQQEFNSHSPPKFGARPEAAVLREGPTPPAPSPEIYRPK